MEAGDRGEDGQYAKAHDQGGVCGVGPIWHSWKLRNLNGFDGQSW
jgi:hypothetical protein